MSLLNISLMEKTPRSKCITQTVCCNIDTDDVIISTSSNVTNLNIKIWELDFEKILGDLENTK